MRITIPTLVMEGDPAELRVRFQQMVAIAAPGILTEVVFDHFSSTGWRDIAIFGDTPIAPAILGLPNNWSPATRLCVDDFLNLARVATDLTESSISPRATRAWNRLRYVVATAPTAEQRSAPRWRETFTVAEVIQVQLEKFRRLTQIGAGSEDVLRQIQEYLRANLTA